MDLISCSYRLTLFDATTTMRKRNVEADIKPFDLAQCIRSNECLSIVGGSLFFRISQKMFQLLTSQCLTELFCALNNLNS